MTATNHLLFYILKIIFKFFLNILKIITSCTCRGARRDEKVDYFDDYFDDYEMIVLQDGWISMLVF